MRHDDPHIQELIEQMQGALCVLAPSGVLWSVHEEAAAYHVHCTLFAAAQRSVEEREARIAPKIYILKFTVSRTAMLDCVRLGAKYWDSFKWNLIRQCVCKLATDAKPAPESEVQYMAEVPYEVK